jgi:hypothetical protein
MERDFFGVKSQCFLSNAIPFSTSPIASLTNLSAFTRWPPLSAFASCNSRCAVRNASSAACMCGWSAALARDGNTKPRRALENMVLTTVRRETVFIVMLRFVNWSLGTGGRTSSRCQRRSHHTHRMSLRQTQSSGVTMRCWLTWDAHLARPSHRIPRFVDLLRTFNLETTPRGPKGESAALISCRCSRGAFRRE